MSKSKLSNAEILALRESGETLEAIADKAPSRKAVSKRPSRHSRSIVGGSGGIDAILAEKRQMLLDAITKQDIKGMTPAQRVTAFKALNPRKRVQPLNIEEFRAKFRPVDLSIYETIPCDKGGLPQACKASPTCRMCRPDEPFTSDEIVKVGEFTSIQQVKCRTETCRNQATIPMPKYGEAFGRTGCAIHVES